MVCCNPPHPPTETPDGEVPPVAAAADMPPVKDEAYGRMAGATAEPGLDTALRWGLNRLGPGPASPPIPATGNPWWCRGVDDPSTSGARPPRGVIKPPAVFPPPAPAAALAEAAAACCCLSSRVRRWTSFSRAQSCASRCLHKACNSLFRPDNSSSWLPGVPGGCWGLLTPPRHRL